MCFLPSCIRFGFHFFQGCTTPSKAGTSSDDFCLQPTAPTNHSAKMSKPLMDTFAWISKFRKDSKVLKHPAIKRNTHAFCFQPIHPNHLDGFASRSSARGNSQSKICEHPRKEKAIAWCFGVLIVHIRKSLNIENAFCYTPLTTKQLRAQSCGDGSGTRIKDVVRFTPAYSK